MIPSVPTHSNVSTPINQDHLYLSSPPPPSQQQQQFHPQQFQQQRQVQQNQHHQSLAPHLHVLHLVENLADAIDNGGKINQLNNHFEKWQQLLNSIAASINTKAMAIEGQKRKLEESEQLLNQRRDPIAEYRSSVEDFVKTES